VFRMALPHIVKLMCGKDEPARQKTFHWKIGRDEVKS
jgi:hypothetical protein